MIESTNNFEYKKISLDGLDITKHNSCLDTFRKQGWVVFRSSPDPKLLNFKYSLKRPVIKDSKIL